MNETKIHIFVAENGNKIERDLNLNGDIIGEDRTWKNAGNLFESEKQAVLMVDQIQKYILTIKGGGIAGKDEGG